MHQNPPHVSGRSFNDVVAALEKATGDVTDGKYDKNGACDCYPVTAPFSGRPLTHPHAGARDLFSHTVCSPAARRFIVLGPLQRIVMWHGVRGSIPQVVTQKP
jgi:hypothetical protein